MKTKLFVLTSFIVSIFALSVSGCELFNGGSNTDSSEYTSNPTSSSNSKTESKNSEVKYKNTWSYDNEEHWHDDEQGLGLKKSEEKHTFVVRTLEATYFSKGKIIHTCSKCGYSYEEETDILVHKYDNKFSYDEHTHWYACLDSGYENIKKEETPHDFEISTIEPTFLEEGKTKYTCKICGYSYETTKEKLKHNYNPSWTHDENKHWHACVDEGFEDLKKDEANHRFFADKTPATYTSEEITKYICQDCGYSYTEVTNPALEHNYSKTWKYDETKHWHPCVDKGFESLKGDEANHNFDVVTTPASFEEQGYTTYTCKDCGYSYKGDFTEIFDHSFTDELIYDDFGHWHKCADEGYENEQQDYELHDFEIVKKDPSFEEEGSITYSCSICGYEYSEIYGEKIPHNYSEEWSSDKTHHWHACTDEGYEDTEKGNYGLHNFAKKSIPATYEHEGTSTFICKTCGFTYTALDNEQLEHIFADEYSMDATGHWHACLDDGYANYKPDFEGHNYSIVTTPATIYDKGNNYYKCNVCGYEYNEEIASIMEQSLLSLKFALNDDGASYSVTRYVGPAKEIYIPDTFNGLPVTSVNDYVFNGSEITYLKINDNISTLPWGIIYNCKYLTTFDIGNSVTYFGYSTWNDENLKTLIFGDSFNDFDIWNVPDSIEEYIVSEGNETYFSDNGLLYSADGKNLVSIPRKISGEVIIKDGVTNINQYAGRECKNVESIVVPSSVTNIQYGAFQNCTNLKSITFNNDISGFYNYILDGCYDLEEINLSDDNPYLKKVDGAIYNSSMNQLVKAPLKYSGTFDIPESVNSLSDNAFAGCKYITEVNIPSTISYLSNSCFKNCISLQTVNVFSNDVSIYSSCFYDCENLEMINLDGICRRVYSQCFYNCKKLRSLPIDENTTFSGSDIFTGCDSLGIIENNCIYLPYEDNPYYFLASIVERYPNEDPIINDNCVKILPYAFYSSGIKNVVIPNNVISIESYAFYNCASLNSVTIGNGVENIGDYAFGYCNNLKDINLPSNLKSISGYVFCYVNIKELIIPESVTSLNINTFAYAEIENVIFEGTTSGISSNGYCLLQPEYESSPDYCIVYYFYNKDYVIIPSNVTSIRYAAFYPNWNIDAVYCERESTEDIPNWYYNSVNNDWFNNAPKYFYSSTYKENCWRYVDGVPTLW